MSFTWFSAGIVTTAVAAVTSDMLAKVWDKFDYCIQICYISGGENSSFVSKLYI